MLGSDFTPTSSRHATPATASRAGNQGPLRVANTAAWDLLSAASVAFSAFDPPPFLALTTASMPGTRITARLEMKATLEAEVVLSDLDWAQKPTASKTPIWAAVVGERGSVNGWEVEILSAAAAERKVQTISWVTAMMVRVAPCLGAEWTLRWTRYFHRRNTVSDKNYFPQL